MRKRRQRATLGSAGLLASAAVPHCELAEVPPAAEPAAAAGKGRRAVYLDDTGEARQVPVFTRERLGRGHRLAGPAIVESGQTTLFVPQGWRLEVDRFNHVVLHRDPADQG